MKRKIVMISIAACLLAAIAVFALWRAGCFLPQWIRWNERQIVCLQGPDEIVLEDKEVVVYCGGSEVWRSDRGVPVQDILWRDIDHDGEEELMLLCWRRGTYGDSRPFWVKRNDRSWSQHIFIYDWIGTQIHPIWMASDIRGDAAQWRFHETQRLVITDPQGKETAWDWVSWGLQNIPLQQVPTLRFAAVGDNLIHSQIYDYAFRHFDGRFDDLFAYVREELDRYDVTSINQETIHVDKPEQYGSFPSFGTPIQVGQAVIDAGFDIVSCATNHALDRGVEGIDLTVSLYDEAHVVCAGIQHSEDKNYRPYEIFEKNGIRCAVFSYTQTTNGQIIPAQTPYVLHTLDDEARVRQDLAAGRADADLCLVYVHWGTEYAAEPDAEQLRWAQIFADCGADVVIGTHPHVLQPWQWLTGEQGNRTLVYYSLGNFISAQVQEGTNIGGMAFFTVMKEDDGCVVTDCGLKELITEHENGHYTTKLMPQ